MALHAPRCFMRSETTLDQSTFESVFIYDSTVFLMFIVLHTNSAYLGLFLKDIILLKEAINTTTSHEPKIPVRKAVRKAAMYSVVAVYICQYSSRIYICNTCKIQNNIAHMYSGKTDGQEI
ncbi:hypothetical protein ACJX0J_022232, partial [Zea mays]